jgi:hypothetical protein
MARGKNIPGAIDYPFKKEYQAAYKKSKHNRPGESFDVMDEDYYSDELHRKWHEFVYSNYCGGSLGIGFGGIDSSSGRSFTELRRYARGEQSPVKYQNILDPKDANGNVIMNISWDIPSPMPKFRDVFIGMLTGIDWEVSLRALDEFSRKEREVAKGRKKLRLNPEMKRMIDAIGVQPTQQVDTNGLQSPSDVELIEQMGGERLAWETLMQIAILSTRYESKWDSKVRYLLASDIFDLARCAVLNKLEASSGKVKAYYVDPAASIPGPSKEMDGSDRQYFGILKKATIKELRELYDIDEATIYQIAKRYRNLSINSTQLSSSAAEYFGDRSFREQHYHDSGRQVYDNFTVWIQDLYFIAGETEHKIVSRHPKFDTLQSMTVPKDTEAEEGQWIEKEELECVYNSQWVLGTKVILNARKEYGIARSGEPGMKRAELPVKYWQMDQKSLTERCIGILDDICLAVFKKRDALAKLPPAPRILFDKSKVRDTVKFGSQDYSIIDMVKMFARSGILVYESEEEFGGIMQNQGSPIQFAGTGMIEDIQIFVNEVAEKIDQLRQIIGLNPVSDGTADAKMLVGVAEGLDASTNNALRPHFQLYEATLLDSAQHWVFKWQASLINGDIDVLYSPVGENTVKAANLTKDLMQYEFGVIMEVLPTQREKAEFMQFLMTKRDSNQLSLEDYAIIQRMVNLNQMARAQLYASRAVAEKEFLQHQRNVELTTAQAQAQGQAAIQAEQAKRESEEHKAKLERDTMTHEYRLKAGLAMETATAKSAAEANKKGMELAESEATRN